MVTEVFLVVASNHTVMVITQYFVVLRCPELVIGHCTINVLEIFQVFMGF